MVLLTTVYSNYLMSKKGTPRNQRPRVSVEPPNKPISREQLDANVTVLVTRLKDLARSIDIVLTGYNTFIRQQKLPKEDKKED